MIDVDELIITITACICTLSDLEKEVDCLAVIDNMSIRARLKWAWAETTISGLLERVQHHKLSLNLMLTILTWYVLLNRIILPQEMSEGWIRISGFRGR